MRCNQGGLDTKLRHGRQYRQSSSKKIADHANNYYINVIMQINMQHEKPNM